MRAARRLAAVGCTWKASVCMVKKNAAGASWRNKAAARYKHGDWRRRCVCSWAAAEDSDMTGRSEHERRACKHGRKPRDCGRAGSEDNLGTASGQLVGSLCVQSRDGGGEHARQDVFALAVVLVPTGFRPTTGQKHFVVLSLTSVHCLDRSCLPDGLVSPGSTLCLHALVSCFPSACWYLPCSPCHVHVSLAFVVQPAATTSFIPAFLCLCESPPLSVMVSLSAFTHVSLRVLLLCQCLDRPFGPLSCLASLCPLCLSRARLLLTDGMYTVRCVLCAVWQSREVESKTVVTSLWLCVPFECTATTVDAAL